MVKPTNEFIRETARHPRWQLFFSAFPKCVDTQDCWDNSIGLYASVDHKPIILDGQERDITIKFDKDNLIALPKLRNFLNKWDNPNGYRQASVILKDENSIESSIPFTIKYLITAQPYDLSITANYHRNDS